jgi:hypothetical protein
MRLWTPANSLDTNMSALSHLEIHYRSMEPTQNCLPHQCDALKSGPLVDAANSNPTTTLHAQARYDALQTDPLKQNSPALV